MDAPDAILVYVNSYTSSAYSQARSTYLRLLRIQCVQNYKIPIGSFHHTICRIAEITVTFEIQSGGLSVTPHTLRSARHHLALVWIYQLSFLFG